MNIIIESSNVLPTDRETLFGEEEVIFVKGITQIPNLLVHLGIYKSTTQARNTNRVGFIPKGWTDHYKASKKVELFIWNPSE